MNYYKDLEGRDGNLHIATVSFFWISPMPASLFGTNEGGPEIDADPFCEDGYELDAEERNKLERQCAQWAWQQHREGEF